MEPDRKQSRQHLTKGDIVSIPCEQVPNDDTKRRKYLIVWEAETETFAVCPITSKPHREHKVPLECKDLQSGDLIYSPSYIRPNFVYTLSRGDGWQKVGTVKEEILNKVTTSIKGFCDQLRKQEEKSKPFQRPASRPRLR